MRWDVDDGTPQRFPARIAVQSVNEPGSLAQIAQVIAEHDGNIDNIRMSAAVAGLHLDHHRSRGLRPQASHRHHRATARQADGRQGRAGERLMPMPMRSDDRLRSFPFASASTSITSRPSATRAAGVIPIRCARPSSRSRPAPTASPRICARIAGISATTISPASRRDITKPLNFEMAATAEMVGDRPADSRRTPPASCRNGASERTTEGGLDAAGQARAACAGGRRAQARPASASRCSSRRSRADRGGGRARARR